MLQLDKSKVLSDQERIILKRCKDSVIKIDPDAEIILYGPRARGDSHNESDYDLLIKGEKKLDLEYEDVFRRALYPIELETGVVLTVIYIDNQSWDSSLYKTMPFYKNITREGIAV